jgi:uncharacterized protein (TIGR03435 family)
MVLNEDVRSSSTIFSARIAVLRVLMAGLLCFGMMRAASAGAQEAAPAGVTASQSSFEVASVKPSKPDDRNRILRYSADRITIENFTLKELIAYAYGLKRNSQVIGGPDWLDKTHFDIVGVVGDAEVAKLRSMPGSDRPMEWNLIMQSFLAERFRLKVSSEKQEMPIFALVVAKSGSKLKLSTASDKYANISWSNQRMTATGTSMDRLAAFLTQMHESEERTVVNRTGLTGVYDFTLDWSSDSEASDQTDAADMFTALREQLGLDLKPDKAPVDVVVVESAKEPDLD